MVSEVEVLPLASAASLSEGVWQTRKAVLASQVVRRPLSSVWAGGGRAGLRAVIAGQDSR